jgi:hypothetical protein
MQPIQALKNLIIEDQKRKYPNLPEHAHSVNTFQTAKPEKREKKRIELFLNLSGHYARIIENRGQRLDNRQVVTDVIGQRKIIGSVSWIGSGMKKGIADLIAHINGQAVHIEVKRVYKKGKDRQSPDQKKEQEQVESIGIQYWIVSGFDEFYYRYLEFI